MENFKQQNEEEVIRVWGSVENYERLINKVKADEQRWVSLPSNIMAAPKIIPG
mgnify:CR=1 FL=1